LEEERQGAVEFNNCLNTAGTVGTAGASIFMYSSSKGVKIYYEVSGEGLPFVMIHANPFDHNLWMYQIARFSTYFKVVAVDIRGYGRSDKPTTPFSLKDMTDDVFGVCRDLEISEAIIGGVSVGSGMALLMGLDHPELCKAIILVGGSSGPGGSIDRRIEGYTKVGVEKYHIQHLRALVTPAFAQSKLGSYLLNTFVERDPWLSGESIGQIFRARGGTDMTPRLGTMKVPALVINGEHDNSLAGGRKTASLIPGAIHRVLPNTGHACNIEDPAGFDALVMEFLKSHNLMPAGPSR
jgi:3-oxoadipate enol-lactonase